MNKSAKKGISVLLATTVLTSPFVMEPKAAHALSIEEVSADDTDVDEETEYTIEFEIAKELASGDLIYVRFPSDFTVDKKLKKSDVSLKDDGDKVTIDSVSVNKNVVEIEVGERIKKGSVVTVTIDNVTNPEDKGSYSIEVKTSSESTYKSKKVTIGKSSSSSSSKGDFEASHSNKNAEESISLTLGKFTLASKSSKLKEGKYIYVDFPTKDMLPKSISKSDVKVNGYKAEYVSILDSDSIRIEIPSGADGDNYIKLEFSSSAGIVNPSTPGKSYYYTVEYDSKEYKSKDVEITGASSTPFSVSLSDNSAGARSSYTFDIDLASKLYSNTEIQVEFPNWEMVPPVITNSNVTVNGDQVTGLSVNGNKVFFRTPSGFSSTNRLTIKFAYEGYLTNPKSSGTYNITAKIDNKTYKSKDFQITGVTAPVPVDNTLATIGLTRATASTPAGLQVGIKGIGVPIVRNQGFIEIVFPVGFRVPAYVPANTVTVNGVAANYVGARGQNLIIVPSTDIPARAAVQVNIAETAGIVNPATPGVYSIGVYTSEEKGLLFARPATVVALNGVSFKANVASFTKSGKTTALAAAPYTVNGHTLIPTTFFRDALGFSVSYTKTTAKVVSGNTVMQFKVGSNIMNVNGQNVTLPTAVQLKNNIPALPLKAIADRTGYKIIYVNGNYTVYK
ncbi:copper amine oxidase N-terminal domain-containing protein [Brevibacillus agri]|uniref:copper amine oxidase N-terminal domain-containing protein n=1 Tax=Brevibacillus agri TaxID=51101 RepID=UPI001C8D260B|nr:copper amine oxidase N-terminal domain-containing protein [Brevibacillus agri]MBY0052359.1 copper amine oxidase N-terminal domain-containing protein [Brevibacillus agri]MED1645547.1 copper amine oxidase N-terminal domain-containing protein [Brevibacillus agri]MED1654903.1 copper amine oxidase N-terminal domain-containing protein [Brevibacillus agri]MED1685823.1 copper amine oxidase N-terminal domain-containing protein [Brevibacillus agri]MED1694126.1 copper amine oxidase N-terminal domain-c